MGWRLWSRSSEPPPPPPPAPPLPAEDREQYEHMIAELFAGVDFKRAYELNQIDRDALLLEVETLARNAARIEDYLTKRDAESKLADLLVTRAGIDVSRLDNNRPVQDLARYTLKTLLPEMKKGAEGAYPAYRLQFCITPEGVETARRALALVFPGQTPRADRNYDASHPTGEWRSEFLYYQVSEAQMKHIESLVQKYRGAHAIELGTPVLTAFQEARTTNGRNFQHEEIADYPANYPTFWLHPTKQLALQQRGEQRDMAKQNLSQKDKEVLGAAFDEAHVLHLQDKERADVLAPLERAYFAIREARKNRGIE